MKKTGKDYRHDESALMRPEAGAQHSFRADKTPQQYRYDSSFAPALQWDENAARVEGEQLLRQIAEAKDLAQAKTAAEKLQRLGRPFLNWSGKAEHNTFDVPTLPLFVHERLSVSAIMDTLEQHKRDRTGTLGLFNEGAMSITDKISRAYQHMNGWQNRLILGDSLQVMNSLLQYEHLGGSVQMVYMDPPYGIKFGSNFQPYVRKRDVKDGDDDSITREPEMVQAYRDTWELGTHSWLTYMRDRLLLARQMLTDSGSCFVQISDENVHLVRSLMDEIFERENFVSVISYASTSGFESSTISRAGDYVVWYAKDKEKVKYNQLYIEREFGGEGSSTYNRIELADGTKLSIAEWEKLNDCKFSYNLKPEGARVYTLDNLVSQGASAEPQPFKFQEKTYHPSNGHWKANYPEGMKQLAEENRIEATSSRIGYVRYFNDFPAMRLNNLWKDTGSSFLDKYYVVQTTNLIIQRCMLMTTDPGDLVFDPTCGSGTTAYVAEQWGRRWITTDVSRVPLSLARQRLLTAVYPYYQLKGDSPSAGFEYKRRQNKKGEEVGGIVPHVTLKSIANDEPPAEEVLTDKPETDNKKVRVSGPFCVEAIMPPPLSPQDTAAADDAPPPRRQDSDSYIPRMVKILRMSPNICLAGNQTLDLKDVRPAGKSLNFHAEASVADGEVAVVFGPEMAAIIERVILDAAKEAVHKQYAILLVIAFAIEPSARKAIEECEKMFGIKTLYVQALPDLAMFDLLKNMRSSEVFAVCGMPEITLKSAGKKDKEPLYQVALQGLDVFDPVLMKVHSLSGEEVPCWMLDTDYDGQCFRAGQVFFPRTAAWDKIKRALCAEFKDSALEHLQGVVSAPFVAGVQGQVAVKAIDQRGNELLVVKKIEDLDR